MYKGMSVEGLSMETVVMQGSFQDLPLKFKGVVHYYLCTFENVF
jgi:hypothetical protein